MWVLNFDDEKENNEKFEENWNKKVAAEAKSKGRNGRSRQMEWKIFFWGCDSIILTEVSEWPGELDVFGFELGLE